MHRASRLDPTRRGSRLSASSYQGASGFHDTCGKNNPIRSLHPIRLPSKRETVTKRSHDWIKLVALTRSYNARLGMRSFFFHFSFRTSGWLRSSRHRHMATEDYEGNATTVSNFKRYYYFDPFDSARCPFDGTRLAATRVYAYTPRKSRRSFRDTIGGIMAKQRLHPQNERPRRTRFCLQNSIKYTRCKTIFHADLFSRLLTSRLEKN